MPVLRSQQIARSIPDSDDTRALEHFRTRKEKPPSVLYKYATLETARQILRRQKLRFSSPLRFNDPFDSQWDPVWSIQTDEARAILREALERAISNRSSWPAETPPRRREILSGEANRFARMSPEAQANYIADLIERIWTSSNKARDRIFARIEDIRRRARICCFCEEANGILMWSHYAANHRGVALGFASAELESAVSRPLEPVRYFDSPPVLVDPTQWAASAVFGLADPEFKSEPRIWQLAKASIWKYEREWRFALIEPLAPLGALIGYFRDFDFPGTALVELVFGCKAENRDEVGKITALATALNPKVQNSAMTRHPERFELLRSDG